MLAQYLKMKKYHLKQVLRYMHTSLTKHFMLMPSGDKYACVARERYEYRCWPSRLLRVRTYLNSLAKVRPSGDSPWQKLGLLLPRAVLQPEDEG